MGMLAEWRAARERRRRAGTYLDALLTPPEPGDLRWLTDLAGTDALARRELDFARRAIGLIVAERDALDDRTASDVAHRLAEVVAREARVHPEMGRAWSERWRAYTATLAVRGEGEAPAARLARVMLGGAGVTRPNTEQMVRATQIVLATRSRANEALRAAFGAASLPEDVRPSAMRS
jgi:hypothetical protein